MKAADEQYMDVERADSELNIDADALMEMGSRNLLIIRDGCEISRSSFLVLKALLFSIRRRWVDQEIAVDFIGSSRKLQELVRSGKVKMRLYMGIAFYREADLARYTVLLPEPSEQKEPVKQRQSTALGLAASSCERERHAKPSPIPTATSDQLYGLERQDEELVTVKEAADLLKVNIGTMWDWVDQGKIESVTIAEKKSRSHLVKMSSLRQWISSPFATQRHYSFTELGEMPDISVSRQTIRSWQRKGLIEICLGPGGQPYVLKDQLPKCRELAQKALIHKTSPGRLPATAP